MDYQIHKQKSKRSPKMLVDKENTKKKQKILNIETKQTQS